MKFRTLLLLSLLLLSACGQPRVDPRSREGIDDGLLQYVKSFESYAASSIGDISVYFSDIEDERLAGTCTLFDDGYAEIEIDRGWWSEMTKKQRTDLVFHELGHCFYGRNHKDVVFDEDGCPESFMYGEVMADWCLDRHFGDLMKEMFQ